MSEPASSSASKALILDDDELFILVLAKFLNELKVPVISFTDAHQAFQEIEQRPEEIKVMFLDLVLHPSTSGLEILSNRNQKKWPWAKAIFPVIVMSSHGDLATIKKALSLGANNYIIKPPSVALIEQRLIELNLL